MSLQIYLSFLKQDKTLAEIVENRLREKGLPCLLLEEQEDQSNLSGCSLFLHVIRKVDGRETSETSQPGLLGCMQYIIDNFSRKRYAVELANDNEFVITGATGNTLMDEIQAILEADLAADSDKTFQGGIYL